jgi:hypothetical protein
LIEFGGRLLLRLLLDMGITFHETVAGRITGIIILLVGIAIVSSYFVSLATVAVTMQAAYIEGETLF